MKVNLLPQIPLYLCALVGVSSAASAQNHGAIAFKPSNHMFGFSYQQPTEAEAKGAAQRQCEDAGAGADCTAVAWFTGCGSLSRGPTTAWGAAVGVDAESAKRAAVANCANFGSGCYTVLTVCADTGRVPTIPPGPSPLPPAPGTSPIPGEYAITQQLWKMDGPQQGAFWRRGDGAQWQWLSGSLTYQCTSDSTPTRDFNSPLHLYCADIDYHVTLTRSSASTYHYNTATGRSETANINGHWDDRLFWSYYPNPIHGIFSMDSLGHWSETQWHGNSPTPTATYQFKETGRDADFVYLYDASRDTSLRLGRVDAFAQFGQGTGFKYLYTGQW